jgi:hypothetical protein
MSKFLSMDELTALNNLRDNGVYHKFSVYDSLLPTESYIYGLFCVANNKWYIGSSTNPRRRYIDHKHLLKNNKHRNIKLQRAFNKYGISEFRIYLIQPIRNNSNISEIENGWIRLTNACETGFNVLKSSSYVFDGKRTSFSPETRQKSREANLGRIPWNKGMKFPKGSSWNAGLKTGPSPHRKPVLVETGGVTVKYESLTVAAKHLGVDFRNLGRVMNNKSGLFRKKHRVKYE